MLTGEVFVYLITVNYTQANHDVDSRRGVYYLITVNYTQANQDVNGRGVCLCRYRL